MPKISKNEKRIKAKKIAMYMAENMSHKEIAEKMNIHVNTIGKYLKTPELKRELESIGMEFITFKKRLREEVTKRLTKIVDTLDHHLDQKNLKAVEQVVKIMQLDKTDNEQKDSNITVNLDLGIQEPKYIEGEAHAVQNGQGTNGLPKFIGGEPGPDEDSDSDERIYTTELSEDDLSHISEPDAEGTDGAV